MQRVAGIVMGALIGDALALGCHWCTARVMRRTISPVGWIRNCSRSWMARPCRSREAIPINPFWRLGVSVCQSIVHGENADTTEGAERAIAIAALYALQPKKMAEAACSNITCPERC